MNITTVDNFIKDAVIDSVLADLNLKIQDLKSLDDQELDMFSILCCAKEDYIEGLTYG